MSTRNTRTETITIRLTDAEKITIVRKAEKRMQSITRYVIESAIVAEPRSIKEIRPVLETVRKLTDEIRRINKQQHRDGIAKEALYEIAKKQQDIFELLQRFAANGGY